jgi:hypothetical protein
MSLAPARGGLSSLISSIAPVVWIITLLLGVPRPALRPFARCCSLPSSVEVLIAAEVLLDTLANRLAQRCCPDGKWCAHKSRCFRAKCCYLQRGALRCSRGMRRRNPVCRRFSRYRGSLLESSVTYRASRVRGFSLAYAIGCVTIAPSASPERFSINKWPW